MLKKNSQLQIKSLGKQYNIGRWWELTKLLLQHITSYPVKMTIKRLINYTKNTTLKGAVYKIAVYAILLLYLPRQTLKASRIAQGKKFVKCLVMDNKMYLDCKDHGICRDLMIEAKREPYLTSWWQDNVGSAKSVLDIGANIGYYTLQAAKLMKNEGIIYAIEPIPDNVKLLCKNIALNKFNNISVHQLAIGDKNGKAEIFCHDFRNYASILPSKWQTYSKTMTIPISTMDNFLKDKAIPDIIRMDVEGYELHILRGAKDTLASNHNIKIIIETHFSLLGENTTELLDILKSNGFEITAAYLEPSTIIPQSSPVFRVYSFLVKQTHGIRMGKNKLTISDLYKNKFLTGQVEGLEIVFEKETHDAES